MMLIEVTAVGTAIAANFRSLVPCAAALMARSQATDQRAWYPGAQGRPTYVCFAASGYFPVAHYRPQMYWPTRQYMPAALTGTRLYNQDTAGQREPTVKKSKLGQMRTKRDLPAISGAQPCHIRAVIRSPL